MFKLVDVPFKEHRQALVVLTVVHFVGSKDSDVEVPPPLPQRTPESYELAVDAGWCFSSQIKVRKHLQAPRSTCCFTLCYVRTHPGLQHVCDFVVQRTQIPVKG